MKTAMHKATNNAHAVYADFDNTQLLTNNQKAVRTRENICSMLALRHLVETGALNLIHCTGRVGAQIIRDIETGDFSDLPFPVASKTKTIIAGVGTEIYHLNEQGDYVADEDWQDKMRDTGFAQAVEKLLEKDGNFQENFLSRVSETLGVDINLSGQEIDKQTEFKKSMWGTPQDNVTSQNIKDAIISVMKEEGINSTAFSITVSIQTSKIAVDLTPKGATKPEACVYLMQKDDIHPQNAIMAGDSGNDTHLTKVEGVKTSIPANGQDELVQKVRNIHPEENIYHDGKHKAAAGLIKAALNFHHVTEQQVSQAYEVAEQTWSKHFERKSGMNFVF